MFFLSKKKIIYICILVFIILVYIFLEYIEKKKNTLEVIALPVTNKVVVLDAGHGKPDNGAESKTGVSEQAINLKITKKVQSLLEQSGCNVVLTRSDENGIYSNNAQTIKEKKTSDIKNRVKIGNESSADIFVSIHLNKIAQSKYYGWQTFFKDKNEKSQLLATSIQEGLNNSIQKENKRVSMKISGKYIIEHVEIPTCIVECGFLSNPEEEQKLQEDEYQNRLAWGIYNGIMDYFYEQ